MRKNLHLSCSTLTGSEKCKFIAHGKTELEVINNMYGHMRKKHPRKFAQLSSKDQYKMRDRMHKVLIS